MIDSSINKLYSTLTELSLNPPADKFATRSKIRDAFYDYQMGHCYNPQTIYVTDSITGYLVKREVPCGSCYYCRNNKINEWVTRCYAHLEDFKNAYFVTLTYSPYYDLRDKVSAFMIKYLEDALFFYDSNNKNKRLGFNPCVLCKKHYQDFFKRLRKNTGFDDITYLVCGEYGTDFGRPHFHMIIFTNNVLTLQDIKRAWSVALVHKKDGSIVRKTSNKCPYYWDCKDRKNEDFYFYQSIGRVSFDDLVNNGTLSNENIMIDSVSHTSHSCFAYVCKYCAKKSSNNTRLSLAFNELSNIYNLYKNESNTCNLQQSTVGIDERARAAREWQINEELCKSPLYLSSSEKLFEKVREDVSLVSYGSPYDLGKGMLTISDTEFTYQQTYPEAFFDFISSFGCFLSVSRGCPIGSLYATTHIEEMAQGCFPQPPLQTKGFVVPKYFINKLDSYIYGLRVYNTKGNANKGNLAAFSRLLHCNTQEDSIANFATNYHQNSSLHELLHSQFAFVDSFTKERMLIFSHPINGQITYRVNYYKYNKHEKKYDFLRSSSLASFVAHYILQLTKYFYYRKTKDSLSVINNLKKIRCESMLKKYLGDREFSKVILGDGINVLSENGLNILFNSLRDMSLFDMFCEESQVKLMDNVFNRNKHLSFHKHTDSE